jgi:hypothetical protein
MLINQSGINTGKTGVGSKNHHPDDKLSVVAEKCATGFFILHDRPVSKDQKVSVVSIIFIK